MGEENIQTTAGVSTLASEILWKLVMDDYKLRSRVITIIKKYKNYYKCLEDIQNVKIRIHMMRIVAIDGDNEALESSEPKTTTYLRNVLKYLYKIAIEKAQIDRRIEKRNIVDIQNRGRNDRIN